MENKVLEKNLDQIAKYDKKLANDILMFDIEKANINIYQSKNEEYNIVFNNFLIHSIENPTQEAKNIVEKLENKNAPNTLRIVYGLGLGYLVDELSCEIQNSKIIVYEPNLEILKFVFSIANIDAIFKNNVIVVQDKNKFRQYISNYTDEETKLTMTFLSSYKTLFEKDIYEILRIAQEAQGEHFANKNTFVDKSPFAFEQTFHNLWRVLNAPNISQLKDIYKDKTALCLSAGPSLLENIEIIKENQDKFVIIAANRVVKLLLENNIQPDFVVMTEMYSTMKEVEFFSQEENSKTTFVFEGFVHHQLRMIPCKRAFNYISSSSFLNDWLRDISENNDEILTKGTVSYSILEIANIIGVKKIILCGQDLIFKDGNVYAKGADIYNLKCVYNDEKQKYEIIAQEDIENAKFYLDFLNKNIYIIKNQEGKECPTQTGYALFVHWFEEYAQKLKEIKPDIELINSSIGGAQINGFENLSLKEVVKTLDKIEKKEIVNIKPTFNKQLAAQKMHIISEAMKILKAKINETIETNSKLLKELKIKKVYSLNCEKLIKKHNDLISEILLLRKNNILKIYVIAFVYQFYDLIKDDYFKTPSETIEVIEKLNEIFEKNLKITELGIEKLTDCQTLILK